MATNCRPCRHGERSTIDALLVGGASLRDVGRQFGLSKSSLARHMRHVSKALKRTAERAVARQEVALGETVQAIEAAEILNGDALLAQIRSLQITTLAILTAAEKDDPRTALAGVHQARENVAFLSKLLAELKPPAPTPGEWREMFAQLEGMSDSALDDELVRRGCPRELLERLGTRLTIQHIQVPVPVDPNPPVMVREGSGPRRISETEWEL